MRRLKLLCGLSSLPPPLGGFSPSFGEARRPASAKATAGHPNAAAALGTPAVRRSFSEGGSASGAKAAAFDVAPTRSAAAHLRIFSNGAVVAGDAVLRALPGVDIRLARLDHSSDDRGNLLRALRVWQLPRIETSVPCIQAEVGPHDSGRHQRELYAGMG